ncbi:MAG: carbon monoxide dehydrogenase subunit G [Alphaproteobacteria bacterium]|nr:carbon monoxide dehydrogenase subunit G [Alphaproteobacteria bacterium]
MKLSGEHRIPASRELVWEGLNDPAVLKECIPGCESLEETGENELSATVKAKVGPVSAKFSGVVTLSELNPPESYVISGEGKGGAAGFAKGGAKVTLTADGSDTILNWEADANVGGKLAQIGSRLIDSTAKKMAGQFFGKFSEVVAARAAEAAPAEAPAAEAPAEAAPAGEPVAAAQPAQAPAQAAAQPAAHAETAPKTDKPLPPDYGKGIPMMFWAAGAAAIVATVLLLASLG